MNAGLNPTGEPFFDQLFAILKEKPFRDPILESVRAGDMSREGLKVWAKQTALVVREFTRFISAIHSNCPDRETQLLLAENLWEEHGSGVAAQDHYALARRLARSLGATDGEIDLTEPLPETTLYIDHCLKLTRESSFVESMTAIGSGIEYFMSKFLGALAGSLHGQLAGLRHHAPRQRLDANGIAAPDARVAREHLHAGVTRHGRGGKKRALEQVTAHVAAVEE